MNKVFRVIWNISSQTWVVVSELARGRIKSSCNNSAINQSGLVLGGILSVVSVIPISAEAARNVHVVGSSNVHIETNASAPNSTSSTLGNILIGPSAEVGGTSLPTAIGTGNSAYNHNYADNNIVIGNRATSAGKSNVVLGFGAKTYGGVVGASEDQIAIGTDSFAAGTSSISIGKSTFTNSKHGIAIGTNSRSMGERALAIGEASNAATDGVALGSSARATFAHSIAIGHGSVTNSKATQEGNIVVNGVIYESAAGAVPNTTGTSSYVVSVGSEAIKRQIKNVAPGKISADSTDAINGSQLFQITKGLQGRPITFQGNEGSVNRNLGETLQIQGGGTGGDFSATNVKTVGSGNKVEIQFAQSPTFVNLVTTGTITAARAIQANGGLTIGANQNVSMGNNRVTQVLAGTQATDAVNKGQLDAISNLQFSADNSDSGTIALQTGRLGIKGTSNYVQTNRNGSDVTINLADSVRTKLDNLAANPNETYANKNLGNIDTAGVNKIKQHAKEAVNIQGDSQFTNVSKNNTTGQDVYTVSVNEQAVKTAAQNAISVATDDDISVSTSNSNNTKTFALALNKADIITANDEKVATSKAVHSAVAGAKTKVISTDQSVTVTKTESSGLEANVYDLTVNTARVTQDLSLTFAKIDASNLAQNASNWRTQLNIYDKTETNNAINAAKETVTAGNGLRVSSDQVNTTGGKEFLVSLDETHINDLAKGAVKVVQGQNTTVQEGNDSSGAKTYSVNVNLSGLADANLSNLSLNGQAAVKNIAKDAIMAEGNSDIAVSSSLNNNVKTLAFGLNKAAKVTAEDDKVVTSKAVHSAVVDAKTRVTSSDSYIAVQNTEHSDLTPNNYGLSLNLARLTQDLSNTFVQINNLGATSFAYKANGTGVKATTLSQGLDFVNTGNLTIETRDSGIVAIGLDSATKADIAKRETVVGSNGVTVTSSNNNETGGKEFSVSIDNNYIDGRAKAAVKVANGDNTTVSTTNNENGATTYAVNVDLSNVAQTDLSNLKTEGQNQVKTLAKQAIDVTNADNFTSVEKDTQNGKDTYRISVNQDTVKSAAHSAIEVSNGTDIGVNSTTSDGVKTFALTLNKAEVITQGDTTVATSQAVHSAISGSKTKVNATGDIVTIERDEKTGIEANSYTISVNTSNLKATLNDTFAKVDATNLGTNVPAWRAALDVYNKEETRNEINNAKETVKGSTGINVDAQNVIGKGQEFTVSLDNNHIKAQAKSAVELTGDNHFTTVSKDTGNTDKDVYTVSVSEQAVKAAAQAAIAATGTDDVNVIASTNDSKSLKTFAVSLNKANSITADDEKAATAKAVHKAIADAKTTVNSGDDFVTVQENAQSGIVANSYGISLNTNKLTEHLTNTFAKADASNIAQQATNWRNALNVYDKTETNSRIEQAKESVKGSTGINVSSRDVEGKGQEFTVSVDNEHIKTQAKEAVKVINGTNTTVQTDTDTSGATTYAVNVDLSNLADKNLSNLTEEGNTVVKDLAQSAVEVTHGDNFTIVQKEQKDGKDSYKVSLNEQAVKSTVHNAIAISNNSDISAAPTTDNGVKTFALTLNKANTITQDDTKAATSQAVHSAISAAKTTVDSNSNIVTVTKEEKDGIEANSYTISVNTDHLKTTLNDTFAKVDSSNIGNNAAAWRNTLSVYDKAETDSKINQAKETVEGGAGINVVPENTPNGGQKFTVSVDDSHIKAQAKSAVEVKSGNTFATVEKDQSSTDKDIYTVSVSEQAVKAAAQDAVAVTGNADVTVAASTNDTQNLKTFAVSLNKANSITADDEKVTTAKVVHSAIANAKTTVTADDELVTIRGTAQNGITANNYGISLNTDKLKTNLADTFAKSDATNIGATQATAWRNALDVYNTAQTNTEIAKAKESVKAGAGITVIPKEVAGKGQEFTVAVDDSHIKTQAKQAVKVVNGNNTSVTEGTEGDAKTFRVDVDLSNYATNNALSNAQISYKANSGEAKSTLLSQGLNFTNTGNLAITAKDNGVIELGLDDETKTKLNVRETVIQGTGIVVNGDTNNDTGGKQFTVSVDNNHIKAQAKDAVKVMAQENDDLIIVNSAAGQNGELNYQVGVNKQAVTSAVQNAITATGNDDIEVNAATQNGIKNFSIGLNKAAQLAANEDKIASAGTVYSAVTGAKTTVSSSDNSVEFKTKTESNDLNANHYDISVNTNKLRQDLGDTFAKVDASNIATQAAEWRTALNVYNQAETDTAINRAKETVVAGTGVNVASESTADNGQKFTVSVKNDHIQAQAKEAVKVAAQDSDNFVSVTTDDSTGSTVYKVGVDQQAVTSAAKNAIQVTGNMDISVDTENDTAKTFALTLNKATEVVEGENKALTADAAYKAITGAKTTVAAGDNLVTVTPTESDDLTRNQYSVALNTTALKTHLSTSLNDIFATVNASNIGPQASAWRTALDVYNKTETNNAINLAKETVVNGTGVTVSTGKNSSGAQEFTVALDNSHIQAQAKQAISVTGDADIQVNASEKEGKQDFALSLTKATTVEANNASALTSGAAYTAITEAKTKVTSKDALLTLTKTAESDNLIANEYDVALNRSALKTHLTESLNDTFAKADASNITAKTWRDTLNVYDKTETDSAINAISTLRFIGDSGSSSIALQTGTLGFKGQAGYLETHGHGSDITIQLANGVKNKLDNLADNPNAVYTNQSLSNLNGQGIAKIKEQVGIENGLNTTAIAEEKDGVKTFKVNVDLSEYQKTAELGNTLLSYKANGGEDQTTSLTSGLDFQNKGNLTIATKDNGVVELSLDAQTVKDIAVRETVVAGTGITVTDTETNDTDGKQFRIAVDNAHIKNQAREAVQVAAANNDEFVTVIPNSNTNSGNTTYQVAVSKQAVQAAAKDAVTVTGNSDILVDTKNNAADKSFTLSIDKAKTVTENEEKVVTSGAVYSAVADAKSKVTTDDKFITLTPTESNDLKANQYHLALNTDNLKVHLTENLNDTFAKQDASNVQADVWRSVLDVLSSSEVSSAMNALGWTLKVNQEAEGEKITNDGIVTFNQDQNIEINREGNHINIKTVEAPTFSRVNTGTIITTGSATVGGMLQANGGFTVGERQTVNLGNNVVSGVATGVEETDATNVKQVKDLVANSAWKLSTGSTNEGIDETLDTLAEEDINPNDQVKLQAGKNLKVKREANGVVTYATQDNVSFANVNTDSLNVAGATTLSQLTVNGATVFNRGFGVASGQTVDMGGNRLQNVGNAQNDSDAVNYAQLKSISQSLTDKGLSFEGNSGNTTRKLGETLQIVGGDSTGQFSSKNVHTVATDGKVEVQIAERPTFERVDANEVNAKSVIGEQGRFNGLIADNATLGSKNGTLNIVEGTSINLGGNVLHNLGKGIADTDATNVGQVKELVADSAWTLASGAVEGGVDETVLSEDEKINPNDQLKLQAGKNLKVKREANGVVTYATQDNVSFANVNTGSLNVAGVATLNQLTVNGTTMFNRGFGVASGQIVDMGGNRVQNIGDAKEQGDAVNLKQLQEMSSNLTQAGLNFSGNQGETERHLGQTIAIEGKATTEGPYSSGNIQTVVENGKVEIQIADSPKFDNIEVNQLQAVGLATKNANISDNLTVSGNTTLGGQGKNLTVKEGTTVHMGGNVVSGIANGDISPNSSDAVNGSQLYAIQQLVGQGDSKGSSTTIINSDGTTQNVQISQSNGYTLTTYNVEAQKEYRTNNVIEAIGRMNEQGIKFFHTNDGVVKPDVQGDNTVDSSASGKYATAVGFQAKANGENSVSFGKGSQALGKDTISIGTGNIVSGNNSGALGDPSIVSGDNSYVIGNDNTVTTQNTFVVGNNVTKTVDNSVFLGADTGYVADGKTTKGNAAYTSQVIDGQTYQYAGGKAEEVVGVVSVGHVNPNGSMQTRRIQNVAPGLISENSTDAVNGSQLHSLTHFVNQGWELNTGVVDGTNGIAESATPTKIGLGNSVKINAGQNIVVTQNGQSLDLATSMAPTFNSLKLNQGGTIDMGGNRIQNVGNAVNPTDALNYGQFKAELNQVDSRLRSGIAGAVASASLVQAFNPSESILAVGGGTYRGASAVSLGYSKVSDNGRIIFKLSGSANNYGDFMGGASVGFKF